MEKFFLSFSGTAQKLNIINYKYINITILVFKRVNSIKTIFFIVSNRINIIIYNFLFSRKSNFLHPSLQHFAERVELGVAATAGDADMEILQPLVGFQLRRV